MAPETHGDDNHVGFLDLLGPRPRRCHRRAAQGLRSIARRVGTNHCWPRKGHRAASGVFALHEKEGFVFIVGHERKGVLVCDIE